MIYLYRVTLRKINSFSICHDIVSIRSRSFDVAARVAIEKFEDCFCDKVSCNVYEVIEVTFISEFKG